MTRLQKFYHEKVVADLQAKFGYKSIMQVPRIEKITLNMGVSEAVADRKVMDAAVISWPRDRQAPRVRQALNLVGACGLLLLDIPQPPAPAAGDAAAPVRGRGP